MPRKPDARIDQAREMFLAGVKLIDIANQLELPEGTVRRWKSTHKWDSERTEKKKANVRKRGGQPGNHNATGPPGNHNAEKHGLFSRCLPEETFKIIQSMPTDPLNILWDQIQIAYAAIIRSQQIMYVRDRDDWTKEKISDTTKGEGYNYQQAWDKQGNFLQAQARAQKTLEGMIKQYDDLLHRNWDLASLEQKTRIANMQAQTERIKREDGGGEEQDGVEIVNDAPKASKDI